MIEWVIGASLAYSINKSCKLDAEADEKNAKAFTRSALAETKIKDQQEKLNKCIEKVAKRKQSILVYYMSKFQDVYKVIREIQFEPTDNINEIKEYEKYSTAVSTSIRTLANITGKHLTDKECLCGLAIRGLSGMFIKTSEIKVSAANSRVRQSNVVTEQAETICLALQSIEDRANMIGTVLAQLGMLFNKSIEATKHIIDIKGSYKDKYTYQDKEILATCINIAQLLYVILDTPILDKDGEITKASYEAIENGNEYIRKINNIS